MSSIISIKKENQIEFYADSQASSGSYKENVDKIFQFENFTFGVAGDLCYTSILKYFLKTNPIKTENIEGYLFDIFLKMKKFQKENDCPEIGETSFVIAYNNKLFEIDNFTILEKEEAYLGSGARTCRAAIESGSKPHKAIEITSRIDLYTNNDVKTIIHKF